MRIVTGALVLAAVTITKGMPAQQLEAVESAEIRKLQWEWMEAWKNRDRATLERILAPEYRLLVSADPDRPGTRESWLRSAMGPYVCHSFSYDKMDISVFGDVAVVGSLFSQKASMYGMDRSGSFFLTDVWQRRAGRWQVVRRYSAKPEVVSDSMRALIDSMRRRPPQ